MKDLISVVIPIYNGEKYLFSLIQCLNSQTYKNFEVLFVNDFSTDSSVSILETLIGNDSRYRIITPKNKLGTAVKGQKFALPFCKGEFHFYMSQDDLLSIDFFQKCISVFHSCNADIVVPNCYLLNKNEKLLLGNYNIQGTYELMPPLTAFVESLYWNISGFTMERMSVFKSVPLNVKFYNGEELQKRLLFLTSKCIALVNTSFYYRQDNPNAITKNVSLKQFDVVLTEFVLYKYLIRLDINKGEFFKYLKHITHDYCIWWKIFFKYKLDIIDEFKLLCMLIYTFFNLLIAFLLYVFRR